jgi:hypothetical protein
MATAGTSGVAPLTGGARRTRRHRKASHRVRRHRRSTHRRSTHRKGARSAHRRK